MAQTKYAILDSYGRPLAVSDTLAEATDWAMENRPGTVFFAPNLERMNLGDAPTANPRSRMSPVAQTYKLTGLPALLEQSDWPRRKGVALGRHADGQPYIPHELLDKITVQEAWESVRDYLPRAKKYQKSAFGEYLRSSVSPSARAKDCVTKGEGLLGMNAKLAKQLSFDGRPSYCMGLSLAPHQTGLRGGARPARGGQILEQLRSAEVAKRITNPNSTRVAPDLEKRFHVRDLPATMTLCPYASIFCKGACLGFSGQNSSADEPLQKKIAFTQALVADPVAFVRLLVADLRNFWRNASKYYNSGPQSCEREDSDFYGEALAPDGADFFVRLNVYSDVPWERFAPCLVDPILQYTRREKSRYNKAFPDFRERRELKVSPASGYYDYSKVPGRTRAFSAYLKRQYNLSAAESKKLARDAYHLTFSYSGTNLALCKEEIKDGNNVAVVFIRQFHLKGEPEGYPVSDKAKENLRRMYYGQPFYPWKFLGLPVINGDLSDIRAKDRMLHDGPAIVGLDYKVPLVKVKEGKKSVMAPLSVLGDANTFVVPAQLHEGQILLPESPGQDGVDGEFLEGGVKYVSEEGSP